MRVMGVMRVMLGRRYCSKCQEEVNARAILSH